MQQSEIITRLSQFIADPSEVIHFITMQDVITAIVQRMGEKALTLTGEDLQLARDEIRSAIQHHLDIRDYIDMGLDVWEITRSL